MDLSPLGAYFLCFLPATPNTLRTRERAVSIVSAPLVSATSRFASVRAGASGCFRQSSRAIFVISSFAAIVPSVV